MDPKFEPVMSGQPARPRPPAFDGTVTPPLAQNNVLRNTYWLLALSMLPTVAGAYVGAQLNFYAQFAAPFGAAATITDLAHPKNYTLNVTARLAPGLTLASLAPRLPVVAQRLTALQPADATGERELQVEPPSRFNMSTNPSGDSPLARDANTARAY